MRASSLNTGIVPVHCCSVKPLRVLQHSLTRRRGSLCSHAARAFLFAHALQAKKAWTRATALAENTELTPPQQVWGVLCVCAKGAVSAHTVHFVLLPASEMVAVCACRACPCFIIEYRGLYLYIAAVSSLSGYSLHQLLVFIVPS